METIFKFLAKNKRSLFYAFSTGLGLTLALQLFKEYGTDKFLLVVFITGLLLIFEVYLNWRYATKILSQIDMPIVSVYNLCGHVVNHITLPILLFFSLAGFVYFNTDDLVRLIAISALVFINAILFINIRSYYQDEFKIEEQTRYIYGLIKLIIFFFGVNLILHVQTLWEIEIGFSGILVCFLSLALGLLVVQRKGDVSLASIIYVIVSSFIISIVFMLTCLLGIVSLGVNVIVFLFFYFALSILHHRLERTLTFEIFSQYILILILALLLFLGIS